jgi:sugar phosphate permease
MFPVILEGLLTVLVSFAFFFMLPNFPEEVKWLTEEERTYVKARLQLDQGKSAAERKITTRDVGRIFKDSKIIVGGFMYFGLIVPAYGYAYFSPSIIQSYGYSPIQTQLHSVPPWAAAFGFSMLVAWFSDKLKHRFLFTIIPICVCITGFAILITVHDRKSLQYAALFLVAMGAYTAMPVIVCWVRIQSFINFSNIHPYISNHRPNFSDSNNSLT